VASSCGSVNASRKERPGLGIESGIGIFGVDPADGKKDSWQTNDSFVDMLLLKWLI
jgi:hypothetical protein